jgi:2-oxoglutarate ferredoxin oxidoreductase subunit alpha
VLAPYSLQEAVELIGHGFDLGDKYKMGCILHTEASLGQMMESCSFPEMKERYEIIKENEQMWNSEYLEDAEYVLVAYGLAGRSVIGAVKQLRDEGHKVGYIRPITLWPFPEKAFEKVNANVKGYISIEENAVGQMVEDVALTLKKAKQDSKPVYCMTYAYGVPTMKKIKADFIKVNNGEMKEVY